MQLWWLTAGSWLRCIRALLGQRVVKIINIYGNNQDLIQVLWGKWKTLKNGNRSTEVRRKAACLCLVKSALSHCLTTLQHIPRIHSSFYDNSSTLEDYPTSPNEFVWCLYLLNNFDTVLCKSVVRLASHCNSHNHPRSLRCTADSCDCDNCDCDNCPAKHCSRSSVKG